jgi:two-component system, NtrC family, response regulator PilR
MQSKLLRVIQERAVRPIGAVAEAPVNVRIVSATHKDLGEEVQAGRFRQDLYYRLNVIQHHRAAAARAHRRPALICAPCWSASRATPASRRCRRSAPTRCAPARLCLPGQRARTREPAAARAGAVRRRVIERQDLGLPMDSGARPSRWHPPWTPCRARCRRRPGTRRPWPRRCPARPAGLSGRVERDILVRALERHRYNRTAAGASLGLSLRQMRYRMARLGVTAGENFADPA